MKRPIINLNYLSNTDYGDTQLIFNTDAVISDMKFVIKRFGRTFKTLTEANNGIKTIDNKLFIIGNELEDLDNNFYEGFFYAKIDGVGNRNGELFFTAKISVSENGNATSDDINLSVLIGNRTIEINISQVVNNWGGGSQVDVSNLAKKDASNIDAEVWKQKLNIPAPVDVSGKQDTLFSGTNIKTINGSSILGSGNMNIAGGSGNANVVDTEDGGFSIVDELGNKGLEISEIGEFDVLKLSDSFKNKIKEIEPLIYGDLQNYGDINHVISYGQSLSVGDNKKVITTTNLNPNLISFDGIVRTSAYELSEGGATYPTGRRLSFKPLIERFNTGSSAGVLAETPVAGTVEMLAVKMNNSVKQSFPVKILGSCPGIGATSLAGIAKGTAPYQRLIDDVTGGLALSNAQGKTYKLLAVTWMQGENDYLGGSTSATYKAGLIALKNNINNDVKAITGQTEDVSFIMYQLATSNGGGKTYPNIALAILDCALTEPNMYLASPMYHFSYDNVFHLKASSSKAIGYYFGYVINKIKTEKKEWKPIHVTKTSIQGNILNVKFKVPKPPLKFEEANGITLPNKGFAVIKGGVNILTSVTIGMDGESVNLLCSESPATSLIQYGINTTTVPNTVLNLGNLRDSQGNNNQYIIDSENFKLNNWCPIFEYQL